MQKLRFREWVEERPAAFVVTSLGVLAGMLFLYSASVLRESKVVYISILGGILTLPNDFVLDADWGRVDGKPADMSLKSSDRGAVVIGHVLRERADFLGYLEKNRAHASKMCGLERKDAQGTIRYVVVSDDEDYVVFIGVPDPVIEQALGTLCSTRK